MLDGDAVNKHYEPHFVNGFCNCDCDQCHLQLSDQCICYDCYCESEEDHLLDPVMKLIDSTAAMAVLFAIVTNPGSANVIRAVTEAYKGHEIEQG